MNKRNYYLYLINQEDSNYYKVGYAINLKSRISCLQSGSPQKLILTHSIKLDCHEKTIKKAERRIHRKYKQLQVQGEWFLFDGTVIYSVVDQFSLLKDEFNVMRLLVPWMLNSIARSPAWAKKIFVEQGIT